MLYKNKLLYHLALLPLCATVFLSGCGGHGGGPKTTAAGTTYELNDGVVVLDPAKGVKLVSQDVTTLAVSGNVPSIAVGNVVMSKFGDGALLKATVVSTMSGVTTIVGEQAALTDAFKKLNLNADAFGPAQIGTPTSDQEGVSVQWVDASSKSRASATSLAKKALRFLFNHAKFSDTVAVDGSADLEINPVHELDVHRAPGDLLPTLFSADFGASPSFTGTLTINSKFAGKLAGSHPWYKPKLDPYTPDPELPFIKIQPHIVVSTEIEGTVSSAFDSTFNLGAAASAVYHYRNGAGWTSDTSQSCTTGGAVSTCKNEAKIIIDALRAEVRFDVKIFGREIGGPYAALAGEIDIEGPKEVVNGVEGIHVTGKAALTGEIGLSTSEQFYELLHYKFDIQAYHPKVELGKILDVFFPFTGQGSIKVADNGPAPDDVFDVHVDGDDLGSTDKGGSGQFRVDDLSPGDHSLAITCTDDGANGGDVGTLGVTLADGLTFSDGSAAYSDDLQLGQTVTLTIHVPDAAPMSRRSSAPAMPRNKAVEKPSSAARKTK